VQYQGGIVLCFAGFELDLDRGELRAEDGETIRLRPKTFALLQMFATNANRLLSKQELMSAIWPNVHVGEDSLFQCIREIRAALGDSERQMVKSVSGRGYLFAADIVAARNEPAALEKPGPVDAAIPTSPPDAREATQRPAFNIPARADNRRWLPQLRRHGIIAGLIGFFAVGMAVATPMMLRLFVPDIPAVTVLPLEARTSDPATATMAANVTDRLTDGLSGIGNIRVTALQNEPRVASASVTPSRKADYILRGELQQTADKWQIQARLIEASSGQVQWSGSYDVPSGIGDEQLQQTRLTSSIGNPLALRINALTHLRVTSPQSKIIVEQAAAFINQTNRERFAAAQDLLEKAHAAKPTDVDIAAALSAHLMRGVAMVWYPLSETEEIERRAKALLSEAATREQNYIPLLQSYCRLLQTNNEFTESLVVCQNALRFNPWDGLAMFQIGMAQLRLGRFEDALATFERADAIDTPQVSRWTWPLGVGLALTWMERYEQALPWLQRSRDITPATGRTDFAIAACLQALGRYEEARKAVDEGLRLRPGTTGATVALPVKNQSPLYIAGSEKVIGLMVAAGLPAK
jgi:DNA-binding winged helix-turn-helix (wHTH) protein/tetratricopeptide (TPR) repeat protein